MKTNKTFDCIQFKRQTQTRWQQAVQGMSADQRRLYQRRVIETGPLSDFWKTLTSRSRTASKAGRL
ncbi:MAG: hypothetical protein WC058_15390 [Phycisphaeraceae bacterium]